MPGVFGLASQSPLMDSGARLGEMAARLRHHAWVREHGTDLPEVADWTWEG